MPTQAELNMLLLGAAGRGNVAQASSLIHRGADCNARDYNNSTSLHVAAAKNEHGMVIKLLEMGADINSQDALDNTPLDVAIAKHSNSAATVLRNSGGSQSFRRCVSEAARRSCNAKDGLGCHL